MREHSSSWAVRRKVTARLRAYKLEKPKQPLERFTDLFM
jgi:hypothetical protein